MPPVVISLCDFSGVMVLPWAEAGFECYCVDTRHPIRSDKRKGNTTFTWGDVRSWCPPAEIRGRIGIVFAFPPCTHVASSGARDFRKKRNILLRDSLELFAACEMVATWCGAPYMIENPVGKFSDYMGKPDHTFHPWEYGDNWSKRTCLWTGNGFVMPEPQVTSQPEEVTSRTWTMPDSKWRADARNKTPEGFARAVFGANIQSVERSAAR